MKAFRCDRLEFSIASVVVLFAAALFAPYALWQAVLLVALALFLLGLARCNDIGYPWYYALLLFVPLVGNGMLVAIGVSPTDMRRGVPFDWRGWVLIPVWLGIFVLTVGISLRQEGVDAKRVAVAKAVDLERERVVAETLQQQREKAAALAAAIVTLPKPLPKLTELPLEPRSMPVLPVPLNLGSTKLSPASERAADPFRTWIPFSKFDPEERFSGEEKRIRWAMGMVTSLCTRLHDDYGVDVSVDKVIGNTSKEDFLHLADTASSYHEKGLLDRFAQSCVGEYSQIYGSVGGQPTTAPSNRQQ